MAKYARITTWQVRQIWAASDLKPHRLKTFKISNDPHFAEKVIDVVGLYLSPPDNAMVLSVDEKTQIQALYPGVFTSVTDLKAAIRQFITAHNEHSAKPFKWNKTAEAIIS